MDVNIHKDLLSIILLYTLTEKYENFRCAVVTQDDHPDAEKLKIRLFEESDARKQKFKEN